MAEPIITWGDWDETTRNDPYPLFDSTRAECPVRQIRLADGHDAWLVLSHEAARQAIKDGRLSRDMVAALDDDPEVVDPGLPGPALARHMMNLDPPDHEHLRRLVSRAFLPTRIILARRTSSPPVFGYGTSPSAGRGLTADPVRPRRQIRPLLQGLAATRGRPYAETDDLEIVVGP